MKNKIVYNLNDITCSEMISFFKYIDIDNISRFSYRNLLHMNFRTVSKESDSVKNSLFFTARKNGKLIGYIRCITDFAYHLYIPEVMVAPDYCGMGIGSKLMKNVIKFAKSKKMFKILLLAIPIRESYYKQFGFKNTLSQAMEIRLC